MTSAHSLHQQLLQLDQRGYPSYKQIKGAYAFPGFRLHIDHVQGDPFAAPSRLRVEIPQLHQTEAPIAPFPPVLHRSKIRAVALCDYLTRQFARAADDVQVHRGSGKSGLIAIAPTGQQVLERSAVWINETMLEVRFVVGLPARGRTILGRQAAELLCDDLPQIVDRALNYARLDPDAVQRHIETVEDADWLRQQLAGAGLVAFVPDGAILPRRSGVDARPLTAHGLPFRSPDSLRVQFTCPNRGDVTGMGIPQGITLIVGGGYHGKSTLLDAIALGIYNHIPGDGREGVVTNPTAVKIRAEDGRSVQGVNISPFINHLPQGRSTSDFSTENASGSTSQAANIMEALEVGAQVLLLDEDTSATNFMIRDRRMQALIRKEHEPITPFVDKVRLLYQDYGVSTILVMGGSGDYLDVADTVIAMTDFQPQDVTVSARAIAQTFATDRAPEGGREFGAVTPRIPHIQSSVMSESGRSRLKVRDVDGLVLDTETIDVSALEQLVEVNQLRAIGKAIADLQHDPNPCMPLRQIAEQWVNQLQHSGLDRLSDYPTHDLAMFRVQDLAAVVNRMRSLKVVQSLGHVKR